ncbi:hypothetical protein D0T87_02605 [Bacteroides sp. 51]|nr:hypothetical protein [Bacteroides sp. 51]
MFALGLQRAISMEKNELQEQINLIRAERLFKGFNAKKYVNFALTLMKNGYEPEDIYILAGLDDERFEIVDKYFALVTEKLGLDIYEDEDKIIELYAIHTAEDVISGKISVERGFNKMLNIVQYTSYDSKYIQFDCLAEDFDLNEEGYLLYNNKETIKDRSAAILEEFHLFLLAIRLEIDDSTRESVFCNKCSCISPLAYKTKLFSRLQYACCQKCGSKDVEWFCSQSGKRKILEALEKR